MTTTPHQLCEEDIKHLQRIINIYHGRLNAAWATFFPGEAVPSGHENAPDITSWAPSEISRVLQNFKRHLLSSYYSHNVPAAVVNPTISLIKSGQWLITNCDFAEPVLRPRYLVMTRGFIRDDLNALERVLGVDEAGEMRPLWIDLGEEKRREMFAKRAAKRDVQECDRILASIQSVVAAAGVQSA
ncbi:hypothetical protein EDC01DRAFT_727895 [Geopyxis carbonaria]|nr:hypothetical protein EDC01DRAFT_727895 [Geopyxis carbonaria]